MAAVPPPPGPVVSPELLRLYLMLGAVALLIGSVLIALEHPRQPWALPIALVYAVVGLAGAGMRWASSAWLARWGARALLLVVALAIVAASVGAGVRGYGVAAPSMLLVPVLVFAIAALLGWRAAGLMALLAALSVGLAQALAELVPQAVPWSSLLAGQAVALAVAVLAGGALHARIHDAVQSATRREQRFRRLLGLAADVYWKVDDELRLVTVGLYDKSWRPLAARQSSGQRFDTLPGFVMQPPDRQKLDADVAARRAFRDVPAARRNRDGQPRFYLLSGEPRLGPDGRFRGYWGVARDVSALEATRTALADSHTRFEALFRHAPLPLMVHVDRHIVDANPAAARLLGFESVDAMQGVSLLAFYPDQADRDKVEARLRRLAAQPAGVRLPIAELRMRACDGRIVVVNATAVSVELKGELAVLAMFVDNTERHEAEQALRRSEAMLSHLVNTSPDLITLTEQASGRYHMVNPAFERMLGWSQAEAVGRTALDLGVWGSAAAREQFLQRLRVEGGVSDLPIPFRCRDGSPTTLMISAANFALEGRDMLVINGRDVSAGERERLERAAILDNASIGIAVTRERRFVIANAEFERMIGWPCGSLLGQSGSVVWKSEADYAEVGRLVGPALARGETVELEREVQRRDGGRFIARVRAGVVDAQRPSAGGTVWIVEDVTERRLFEEALARARDAAEAANRAKSAFLANTSHELRTPLNGLLGLARLARDTGVPEAQRQQYLSQIEDSAQTLAAIISDILDLSKIEAGRLPIDSAPFDLVELLQSLARTYSTLAEARGLQLLLDIDPALGPGVHGDALRVRQIVTNYVANAIKFTERGFVRLSARRLPGRGGGVRLECEDTGPGIAAEVLPELFKPFTQADQSTTRRFGGTGLGLSICRELAALMGGQVGVASEEGRGSRFWADLPLAPAVAPAPPAPPAASADAMAALAGLHVLLVEDNAVNMLIAAATLERWGVHVTQAQDGVEALAAIDRAPRPFHLVLMDVQMPGMSGYEATRLLRSRPAGRALPVVALTAAALVSEREQALAAGMDDFLTKPIDAERLQAALLRWRRGREA
ncbi:MAG: PAS domain S-box protein [Ideonella sp. WA131b]|nr:PAS domain S-box protein [Ideonella sp. WA131b]